MLTPNIDLQNKSILIAGAAGFIVANLVMELLRDTDTVKIVGLDSMSDYYTDKKGASNDTLNNETLDGIYQYIALYPVFERHYQAFLIDALGEDVVKREMKKDFPKE